MMLAVNSQNDEKLAARQAAAIVESFLAYQGAQQSYNVIALEIQEPPILDPNTDKRIGINQNIMWEGQSFFTWNGKSFQSEAKEEFTDKFAELLQAHLATNGFKKLFIEIFNRDHTTGYYIDFVEGTISFVDPYGHGCLAANPEAENTTFQLLRRAIQSATQKAFADKFKGYKHTYFRRQQLIGDDTYCGFLVGHHFCRTILNDLLHAKAVAEKQPNVPALPIDLFPYVGVIPNWQLPWLKHWVMFLANSQMVGSHEAKVEPMVPKIEMVLFQLQNPIIGLDAKAASIVEDFIELFNPAYKHLVFKFSGEGYAATHLKAVQSLLLALIECPEKIPKFMESDARANLFEEVRRLLHLSSQQLYAKLLQGKRKEIGLSDSWSQAGPVLAHIQDAIQKYKSFESQLPGTIRSEKSTARQLNNAANLTREDIVRIFKDINTFLARKENAALNGAETTANLNACIAQLEIIVDNLAILTKMQQAAMSSFQGRLEKLMTAFAGQFPSQVQPFHTHFPLPKLDPITQLDPNKPAHVQLSTNPNWAEPDGTLRAAVIEVLMSFRGRSREEVLRREPRGLPPAVVHSQVHSAPVAAVAPPSVVHSQAASVPVPAPVIARRRKAIKPVPTAPVESNPAQPTQVFVKNPASSATPLPRPAGAEVPKHSMEDDTKESPPPGSQARPQSPDMLEPLIDLGAQSSEHFCDPDEVASMTLALKLDAEEKASLINKKATKGKNGNTVVVSPAAMYPAGSAAKQADQFDNNILKAAAFSWLIFASGGVVGATVSLSSGLIVAGLVAASIALYFLIDHLLSRCSSAGAAMLISTPQNV